MRGGMDKVDLECENDARTAYQWIEVIDFCYQWTIDWALSVRIRKTFGNFAFLSLNRGSLNEKTWMNVRYELEIIRKKSAQTVIVDNLEIFMNDQRFRIQNVQAKIDSVEW